MIQGTNNVVFCNPNNPTLTNCLPQGSLGTSYYCQPQNLIGFFQACKILPNCNITPPSPAWCLPNDASGAIDSIAAGCALQFAAAGPAGCPVFLSGGLNVFIPTQIIAGNLASTGALFGFSISGSQAFIAMIGIAVGLISLAGFTVFGSGFSSESVHVLFMGGMLLGFWVILAGLEGFIAGNPASMFSQLNAWVSGTGTFTYVGLTLTYALGFVGSISRGG